MRTDIVNRSFIDVIAKKAMKLHPFQSKAISRFHESIDSEFASISNRYLRLFFDPIDKVDEAVDSFITMSKDFLRCQIRFQETREYPVKNQAQAYLSVYSDKQVMSYYMRGLYLSYFLWPNHWQILKYFRECLMIVASRNKNDSSDALRVLEVAPGHGLFTANIFELIKSLNFLHLVDISETSLSIARENLSTIGFVRCEKITFICADFTNYCAEHEFDFIVMGEVLEHVDDPVRFLIKIKDLLSDKGNVPNHP